MSFDNFTQQNQSVQNQTNNSKQRNQSWLQRDYLWDPYKAIATRTQPDTMQPLSLADFRRVTGGPSCWRTLIPNGETIDLKEESKMQCQVCSIDLAALSAYYRRYKVCQEHARADSVYFNQTQQRFCNRCGRFQSLREFDDNKRSCRLRLDKHNERRRQKRAEDKTKKLSYKNYGGVQKPRPPQPLNIRPEDVVEAIFSSRVQTHRINSEEIQGYSQDSKVDSNDGLQSTCQKLLNQETDKMVQQEKNIDLDIIDENRSGLIQSWRNEDSSQRAKASNNIKLDDFPCLIQSLDKIDMDFTIPEDFDMSDLPCTDSLNLLDVPQSIQEEVCGSFSSAFVMPGMQDAGNESGHPVTTRVVDSVSSWDFNVWQKKQQQILHNVDDLSLFSYRHQSSEAERNFPSNPPQPQTQADGFCNMIDKILDKTQDDALFPAQNNLERKLSKGVALDDSLVATVHDLEREMCAVLEDECLTKLYNYTLKVLRTTPDQLDAKLRHQLVQAIKQDVLLEFYIRPGCIELGVFGIRLQYDDKHTPPSYTSVVQHLLADAFWSSRSFMVQDDDLHQILHDMGTIKVIQQKLSSSLRISSIYPSVLTPGGVLIIEGSCLEGAEVMGRMNGFDVVLDVEEGMDEYAKVMVPEDCCSGLLKIQMANNSLYSNVETVVVIDDVQENTRRVFQDIGLVEKKANEKETSFLIQLGLLLDYEVSISASSEEDGDPQPKREYSDIERELIQKFCCRMITQSLQSAWRGVFMWAMDLFGGELSGPQQIVDKLEQCIIPSTSLLHLAVHTKNPGALQSLVEWGNKHNYSWSCLRQAREGLTPMHFAGLIQDGGLMVRLLVQLFDDGIVAINTPTFDGKTTPLVFSQHRGPASTFETMKLLYLSHLSQSYSKLEEDVENQCQTKEELSDAQKQGESKIDERGLPKESSRLMSRWDSDKRCQSIVSSDIEDDQSHITEGMTNMSRQVRRWDSASSRLKRTHALIKLPNGLGNIGKQIQTQMTEEGDTSELIPLNQNMKQ